MTHIEIINCHAEGEVGDVIIAGVAVPPGDTIWTQSRFIATDGRLRAVVLNEPRGSVAKHVNLLVPPINPKAQAAFIIMEPEDTPPMSGSNCICVATVLLDAGILPMSEPVTHLTLEAPAGLVEVVAHCRNGKAERITLHNVPSFADRLQVPLIVDGHGTVLVDTAFGGDSFVIVDAAQFGFKVLPDEARDMAILGRKIVAAANIQIGFHHPDLPDWKHFSFCFFTGPLEQQDGVLSSRNACVIKPGKIDRSPTGTGCSAYMAVLHAKGLLKKGERFVGRSIIESRFECQVVDELNLGNRLAIIPSVSGRAWITGRSSLEVHADDPWPLGYKISDTWPKD